jgi:hypothetical protein
MEKPKIRRDKETNDLVKEMNRLGIRRFREMFGQEMLDQINEMAKFERRLFPLREKIRLQAKLKYDSPLCEKCINWGGVQAGATRCPHDNPNQEKNITFEANELFNNSLETELCEHFVWKKGA